MCWLVFQVTEKELVGLLDCDSFRLLGVAVALESTIVMLSFRHDDESIGRGIAVDGPAVADPPVKSTVPKSVSGSTWQWGPMHRLGASAIHSAVACSTGEAGLTLLEKVHRTPSGPVSVMDNVNVWLPLDPAASDTEAERTSPGLTG